MLPNKDFEVLYNNEPERIRRNANLIGEVIPILTGIELDGLQAEREAHLLALEYPEGSDERKWLLAYRDPWAEYAQNYLQMSRAEDMKGSEQVVRAFMGMQQRIFEESGLTPNLFGGNVPGVSQVGTNGRAALDRAGGVVQGIKNFDGKKVFGLR